MLQTVLDGVEVASTRDGVEVLLGHRAWAASRRPVGLLSVATDRCGGVRSLLRVFDPCGGGALGLGQPFKVLLVSIGPKPEHNPEPPVNRCRGAHADRSSDLRDMSQKPVLRSARDTWRTQAEFTKPSKRLVLLRETSHRSKPYRTAAFRAKSLRCSIAAPPQERE